MSAKISGLFVRLRHDQRGLTTVEYAIVLCLIAAVVVGTWQKFGSSMKQRLSESTEKIDTTLQSGTASE
jgi:Flp pilus assembly pilin Flp